MRQLIEQWRQGLILVVCLLCLAHVPQAAELTSADLQDDKIQVVQPLPPITLHAFAAAISRPSEKVYSTIDKVLDLAGKTDAKDYTWRHAYVYAAGIHAGMAGDRKRSLRLLDDYLEIAGDVVASAPIPAPILFSAAFRDARSAVIGYREELMKQWGDQRWALHTFKADQVGFEYESAIALRLLQTDPGDVAGFTEAADSRKVRSAPEACRVVMADSLLLWSALRFKLAGDDPKAEVRFEELAASTSLHPVDSGLLDKLKHPPTIVMGFRLRALIAFAAIFFAAGAIVAGVRYRNKGTDSDTPKTELNPAYAVDRSDPMSWLTADWLGLSYFQSFLLAFLLIGGAMAILAWSEDAFLPSGHVVDRAFLDYLSFPYGFGLFIPAFMAGTRFFYRLIQIKLPDLLARCFPAPDGSGDVADEVFNLWRRRADLCNAYSLTLGAIALSIVIVAMQKIQWADDPGTAFVDVRYPGHWSLTGIYHTVVALIIYYYIISCVIRAAIVLGFIAKVYSNRWRKRTGIALKFEPGHPDKCNGVQPIGWILLFFYLLLLLLAAQFLLNLVEKLRFYESVEVVLQHTFVSVFLLGAGFSIIVPILVGKPTVAIHLAMREFRRQEGLRWASLAKHYKQAMLEKLKHDENIDEVSQAYEMIKTFKQEVAKMSLWPFDLKVTLYFIASHAVPLISFLLPIIEKRLGFSFGF